MAAEGIVTDILNDSAAVTIGMGGDQLFRSGCRKLLEQHRLDGGVPNCIDQRFMSENRVRLSRARATEDEGCGKKAATSCEFHNHNINMRLTLTGTPQ